MMSRSVILLAGFLLASSADAAMIDVTVNSSSGPWLYVAGGINSAFQYGVGNQSGPTIISGSDGFSFAAGGTFTIQYLSGTTSANVNAGFAFVDAAGNKNFANNNQANGSTGTYFPSRFASPGDYPIYLSELMGTFADASGAIVGTPFAVGNLRSIVAPTGATRLQLGINDEFFTDNAGSLIVRVTGPSLTAGVVPEPASLSLLGMGCLGVAFSRRRIPRRSQVVSYATGPVTGRRAILRGLVPIIGMGYAGTCCYAIDDKKSVLEKKLKAIRDEFEKGKRSLSSLVIGKFEQIGRDIDRDKAFTEGTRRDKRAELTEAKQNFERYGTMPSASAYDEIAFDYIKALVALVERSDKAASKLMDEAKQKRLPTVEAAGADYRKSLDQQMTGLGSLRYASQYLGTMFRPNLSSIPYFIHFLDVRPGGSFHGRVEDNFGVGGNWSYAMEGQTKGAAFEFRWTRSLRGSISNVYARGYFYGDRLLADVQQKFGAGGGPASPTRIILRRQG